MINTKHLILMRGAPGQGKSTAAKRLQSDLTSRFGEFRPKDIRCTIVSADHYFTDPSTGKYTFNPHELGKAHGQCQSLAEESVKAGHHLVIVDNTNIFPEHVAFYASLSKAFGYMTKVYQVYGDYQSIHDVPAHTLERQRSDLARISTDFFISRLMDLSGNMQIGKISSDREIEWMLSLILRSE